jgi:hypothetical protein
MRPAQLASAFSNPVASRQINLLTRHNLCQILFPKEDEYGIMVGCKSANGFSRL